MHSFGRQFTVLASVDSTNNYAMQKVHAGLANHGDVWFALDQTNGKGQRNKQWFANPGENIMISVVAEPRFLPPANPFMLVATVALGVFDFVKHFAGEKTSIKWPNDIYLGDRKAGGILIENVIRNHTWLYAIIGIGVNINQGDFNGYNATSLFKITGKKYDVIDLAKQLCVCLEKRYDHLHTGNAGGILLDYKRAMYKMNEMVTFKRGDIIFDAVIKDITSDGLLLVETDKEERLSWGSVQWVTNPHPEL